ncbi:branched-chain amino acid transport system ATP-binding protein [Acidovorax soli]|uniref:Branched-chain amino acid transport system ATP-binding protein n=1 Tax=Acidovorax soli TaxID=592050 RepID=A0A7X0PCC5_9BURK|nr:ABC transporter ATP-binding protein [Acidovorax soli]MBB6559315.1 branched-chain amino acid transport system ATP-binding protein [Acidovorax soli]
MAHPQPVSPPLPLLQVQGIEMRFGALKVLDQLDFSVGANEAVGIVGPNGAGKTTLLNVLAGAHAPSQGTVWFRGVDVSAWNAADRCRSGIARTHQVPRPFLGMTVFENVLTAATHGAGMHTRDAGDRAMHALRLCGMEALVNRRAETLGLLGRKRLELVRALATGPTVLLLDEIGGGLTDAEASELVDMVRTIRSRQIAIVWIEHLVHVLLQVAARLVCMDGGRVIASGDPHEVLSDATVVEAYLGGVAA